MKSKCLVCDSTKLQKFVHFDKYPLCIGVIPNELKGKIKGFPLTIGICGNCGHIQQINAVADKYKEVLYKDEYSELLSSVPTPSKTDIGKNEALKCFKFFSSLRIPWGRVLDIGCYDGYFLSLLAKAGYAVQGCEPNPISEVAEKEYNIPIVRDFFSENHFETNSFDVIVLRNLLEHIVELNDFLEETNKVLKLGGHMLIEVPNMPFHLRRATLGGFFHQHLSYFSLAVLLKLFSKHQLEYVDSYGGYELYLCVRKIKGKVRIPRLLGKDYKVSRREIKQYFSQYQKIRERLMRLLDRVNNVAIFGAGGHTTGLIHLLDKKNIKKIKYIYDNNPMKQGNLLGDPLITVSSPGSIKKDEPEMLIISTGLHQDAILEQVKKMKSPKTRITVIYPEVKVV